MGLEGEMAVGLTLFWLVSRMANYCCAAFKSRDMGVWGLMRVILRDDFGFVASVRRIGMVVFRQSRGS